MQADTPPPLIDPLSLITTDELCGLLQISRRKMYGMKATGELPTPIRIGKVFRWRRCDVEKWLASLAARAAGGQ